MAQQPLVSQGLFMIEVSWKHSDTPYSVRLLRTGDWPHAVTAPDNTQHSHSQTYTLLSVFEPAIPASERMQTHATGFGTEVASKRKMRRVHKILAGESEGKRTLENLGIDEGRFYGRRRNRVWWYGLVSSASGLGPLLGYCEYGNEPMSSKKCGEFLDRLDENMLAKRDSARFSRRYCRRLESSWNVTACQLLNIFGSFEKSYCLHLQSQAVQKDLLGCIANETA